MFIVSLRKSSMSSFGDAQDEMDHSLYTVNVDPDHLHSVKMLIDSILSRPKLFQAMQRQLEKAQVRDYCHLFDLVSLG